MPAVTVIKKRLSRKQLIQIGVAVLLVFVVAGVFAGYMLIKSSRARASEENPINVDTLVSKDNSATVTFKTPEPSTVVLEYGTDPNSLSEIAVGNIDETNHEIKINQLSPNTTYYFHIKNGEKIFDNNGVPWSFKTTEADLDSEELPEFELATIEATPSEAPATQEAEIIEELDQVDEIATNEATLSAQITEIVENIDEDITPTPELEVTQEEIIYPTDYLEPSPTIEQYQIPTPTDFPSYTYYPEQPYATGISETISCDAQSSCSDILNKLGVGCSTRDYVLCMQKENPITPAPTAIPRSTKIACAPSYFQSDSCTSFRWESLENKPKECSDTFTKYFVQCKGTSWDSNDNADWYCNDLVDSNNLKLPCAGAPTPKAGQSVFCRVRAETDEGGDLNSTNWVYHSTSCPRISGDDPNCDISYVQGNTCGSWIWDNDYQKDPRCSDKFDHYFMQCTDDGLFTKDSTWYCNMTTENHYNDLPCYNGVTPKDGQPIYCRVRAEDSLGYDDHVSSWQYGYSVCPTSTPTPTPSPTETPTPTNSPTPTP